MKKVCFLGQTVFIERSIEKILKYTLEDILSKENRVEFWFQGCHDQFEKMAAEVIWRLAKDNICKKVIIINVVDPIKYGNMSVNVKQQFIEDGFPDDIVGQIEYAPKIMGKSEKYSNRFVSHKRKIDRWIYRQCDYLLAYYYEDLPDTVNRFLFRTHFTPNLKIIPINNSLSKAKIGVIIENMTGRNKIVIRALQERRTYKSIAKELGISEERVHQIAIQAVRQIYNELRSGSV